MAYGPGAAGKRSPVLLDGLDQRRRFFCRFRAKVSEITSYL